MGPDREELLSLARSLRAETRRRAWNGRRQIAARKQPAAAPPRAEPARAGAAPAERARAEPSRAEPARAGPAPAGPARTPADVRGQAAACGDLASLAAAVARCEACVLARTRTQTVFQDGTMAGASRSGLTFVGEAPGADEDRQGVPFVGRAGGLLTDIITKGMGLARSDVHIANVIKCRPPENRDPTVQEKATCTPWLERQLELTSPRVIVPLGKHAANTLLDLPPETPMGRTRGKVHVRAGRTIVPTYHPAYLLRSPGEKKACWSDIQVAMGVLGLEPPAPREAAEPPAKRDFRS